MRGVCVRAVLGIALLSAAVEAAAFRHEWTEIEIPMRDTPDTGFALAADLFLPAADGSWPVILIQTPYDKLALWPVFVTELSRDPLLKSPDYAFVVMDWRGTGHSGSQLAAYPGSPTHGEDGHDAVEWIADQPWCNGRVGTWGASALGYVQLHTAAEQPRHLLACVPMVYHFREWYDQVYPGGVYARNRNDFVYKTFGGIDFIKANPLRNLIWDWAEANGGDPARIAVPMLHVSGWYDHEALQTVREFRAVAAASTAPQRLLIGPWTHSAIGALEQGELQYPAAEFEMQYAALRFFDEHLRGLDRRWTDEPPVRYFQTNEDRWIAAADWPPSDTQPLELFAHVDGTLRETAPTSPGLELAVAIDPADPVPTLFGPVIDTTEHIQGPGDLRPNEARDDVLTFTMPTRTEPLRIAGDPSLTVSIRCDTPDTDIAARLSEVYPDGRSILLVSAIQRASVSEDGRTRTLLHDGVTYELALEFPPLAVTIPRGHALRLILEPSNYPLYDVNLQDGSSFSDEAGATTRTSTVRYLFGPEAAPRLLLPARPYTPTAAADWWVLE